MSPVSARLCDRRVERFDLEAGGDVCSLVDLTAGAVAQVLEVDAGLGAATARRLFDLGFAPGSQVELVRRAPMADPLVFRVAGYDVALRRAQAGGIRVHLA